MIKLFLASVLTSHVLVDYFIPFVEQYIQTGFSNPYALFIDAGKQSAFPYPAFMLYYLSAARLFFSWIVSGDAISFMTILVYRLPILLADLAILLILSRWLKSSVNKVLWFYWLSPVLIYISYIHGQLDVIPVAVLFCALYFLFKERFILTFLFLGIAIASKTHIALVVPFFMVYMTKTRVSYLEIARATIVLLLTFITLNLPYLFDPSFIKMVFFNIEQKKILALFYQHADGHIFYLALAAYSLLLIKEYLLKACNKDIFIMFLGIAFGVILLFVPPMPGWYYWILPFFTYFYAKARQPKIMLFIALQLLYFLYYSSVETSDFFTVFQLIAPKIAAYGVPIDYIPYGKLLNNIFFTLLQSLLMVNCIWIYGNGVKSYTRHKIVSQPYLIGIGGDSGAGKTTLANALLNIFSDKNTTVLRGDDMHKWERSHDKWQEFTHLNPQANELHKEAYYLTALRQGKRIRRRYYEHSIGSFTSEQDIFSNKVIVFEGLHAFYIENMRGLFDLKIFIKPDEKLRQYWKVLRDLKKRRYTKKQILAQLEKREQDSIKFIDSQQKYADLLVEIHPKLAIELDDLDLQPELLLKLRWPNTVFLDPAVEALQKTGTLQLKHYYQEGDQQVLEISGLIAAEKIDAIAYWLVPGLEEIGINTPCWQSDSIGVLQLLIAYYIMESVQFDQASSN